MAVYAYCRASTDKQVSSCDTQKRLAQEYAAKAGLSIDGYYVDNAVSGKHPLEERVAGKELVLVLRRGDHLIVAHLDRISRSFLNFASLVDRLFKRGVILHACDFPGGVLDPENIVSRLIVHILAAYAEFERGMISRRARNGQHDRRLRGERFSRHAELGWQWRNTGINRKTGKPMYVAVPNERERLLMRRVLMLRTEGYSYDSIRQTLNYDWKVRTRSGGHWSLSQVQHLVKAAFRLACEQEEAAPSLEVPETEDESEYFSPDVLQQLEESDEDSDTNSE